MKKHNNRLQKDAGYCVVNTSEPEHEEMKITFYVVGAVVAVLLVAMGSRLIGITYLRVIEKEPLKEPIRITSITGSSITLEDGRVIELIDGPRQAYWSQVFQESDYLVDVVTARGGKVSIFANQDGWICGTPWASLI